MMNINSFRISEFKKQQLRYQVQRMIAKAPTVIELKRDVIILDEFNGKTRKPITVGKIEVFLGKEYGYDKVSHESNPSGYVKTLNRLYILAVWEEEYEYEFNDYFYLHGLKHRIIYPKNNDDIYWECDIEVILPNDKS